MNCLKTRYFCPSFAPEAIELGQAAQRLFDSLAITSINEAQNIMLHIFTYHMRDSKKQKAILMNVMDYCNNGGIQK